MIPVYFKNLVHEKHEKTRKTPQNIFKNPVHERHEKTRKTPHLLRILMLIVLFHENQLPGHPAFNYDSVIGHPPYLNTAGGVKFFSNRNRSPVTYFCLSLSCRVTAF
jgi:hypothetical protein